MSVNVDTGEVVASRPRVQKFFVGPSLTRQEFKDECDLALTLKKFGKTPEGQLALKNAQGFAEGCRFDDVTAVPDFRAARDAVNAANASFMRLPPEIRRRFDNDPAAFLDFVQDPKNLDEARTLGLAKPAPIVVEPQGVPKA
nr:MAG: internal scaffolding protein [Microvirus sp.]